MGIPKVYLPIIEKMQMKTVNQWTGWLRSTTYLNELERKTQICPVDKVTWEPIGKFLSNTGAFFFLAWLRLQCLSAKAFANFILSHYRHISQQLAFSLGKAPAASLAALKESLQKKITDLFSSFLLWLSHYLKLKNIYFSRSCNQMGTPLGLSQLFRS